MEKMMKKEWNVPALEVLDVNQTMLNVTTPTKLDATFHTDTPFEDLTWS
ncbi:paeninodin family lasso peptide [Paenibacillus eucommiae]|uniref:Paeninodin family lasso peptide n=1 Tax=Paenibacillus eucommiae TaxID=1355755 RepID=A0ABS4ITC5_9BACL|nr:paeninodin family lasso peptide [Paenibacillus eucommiae]MBP1990385.1 hypothetical protein [Paenibacillus eucommiae]